MIVLVAVVLAGLAVVLAAHALARRSGLPTSVLLVVAGIAYGFLPGPNLQLDHEVVLVVVIPPLLYAAALESSLVAIRSNVRAIVGLSVGLVLATAIAVGVGLGATVAAVPLAAGIALGAAVSPPDPVAALSIGRAGLPPRLVTLVEGEGLLNDAMALTILQIAVAAAVGGSFSPPGAVGRFVLVATGGLVLGAAGALLIGRLQTAIDDALLATAVSLATPFGVYVAAEALHVSGVLAVVVAGLLSSHRSPTTQSSQSRLQARAVWRLVEFLLEGYVFLLIGQQLPGVLAGLEAYAPATVAVAGAVTVAVVVLLRPLWILVASRLPSGLHARLGGDPQQGRPPLTGREVLALSWAGTRGVITLAAAFSLPAEMPARDLLLFCAYLVVLVTLLGQGLTLAPLLRRLRLAGADVSEAVGRNEARSAAVTAALARLDELQLAEPGLADVITPLRRTMQTRLQRYSTRLALLAAAGEEDTLPVDDRYVTAVRVRREMLAAERDELVTWRDAGRLPDASLRTLQRELDHQESLLPPIPG